MEVGSGCRRKPFDFCNGTGSRGLGRLAVAIVLAAVISGCDTTYYSGYKDGSIWERAHPSISADGRWILYSSPRSGRGDLYEVSSDGSKQRKILSTGKCDIEPAFFKDNKTVAYCEQSGDTESIYVISLPSQRRYEVAGSARCEEPAPSPDGKQIACSCAEPQNEHVQDLYVIDLATGVRRVVPGIRGEVLPVWASRNRIVYIGGDEPWDAVQITNVDGSGNHELGPGNDAAVSPDGGSIAVVRGDYSTEIWTMRIDGSHRQELYANNTYKDDLTYTPDGTHLLFVSKASQDHNDLLSLDIRSGMVKRIASVL